ncbi:hypothetical protein ACWGNM_17875 [Streptomyces sp. NPDC055796]
MIELKRAIAVFSASLVGVVALAPPGTAAEHALHVPADARPLAVIGPGIPGRATITEGQVKEVAPGGVITYPGVTSCLTVTVRLRDGGLVGAHASLFQVPGELRSDEVLAALGRLTGDRPVVAVQVKGAVGAWHPGYFAKAIESYGEQEQPPYPSRPDPEGLAEAVSRGLSVPVGLVTVEDVPDGDQTAG